MNDLLTVYQHTQRAPLCWLLYGISAVLFAVAYTSGGNAIVYVFIPVAILMLVLGGSFHHLTVADEIDQLAIQFGPLPLFRKTICYEEIVEVEIGRTTVLDGWGIHWSLGGGWVWNIWGRDCVVLHLKQGKFKIGTDDAENLAAFVAGRIADDD